MKNFFLIGGFIILSNLTFGQTHSYSFKGIVTQEQAAELIAELERLPEVSNVKLKYKEEKGGGELLFDVLTPASKTDIDQSFSPVSIKEILLRRNLEPLTFKSRTENP